MDLESQSHMILKLKAEISLKNNIKERTRWIKASKQGCVLPALRDSFIQHCFGVTRLHSMKATERTKNAKFSRNVCKYRIFFLYIYIYLPFNIFMQPADSKPISNCIATLDKQDTPLWKLPDNIKKYFYNYLGDEGYTNLKNKIKSYEIEVCRICPPLSGVTWSHNMEALEKYK